MSRHSVGGGPYQCHQMTHVGGGGQKKAKKVSRIIWMAPYENNSRFKSSQKWLENTKLFYKSLIFWWHWKKISQLEIFL